jgi:hypothetical protein
MDEKPKSIWKKSWRGTGSLLLAWLGLMVATLIIVFVITLASGGRFTSEELKLWMAFSLFATAVIFLVLFIRWLFCRRNLKRTLFCLACFATLIALFYAEEDWRGLHDWNKFKREWEAKGEHFDFKDFVPPPVPDDQNFAMAPIWVESIKATLGPERSRQWFGNNYAENGRTNFTDRLWLVVVHNDDWNNEPRHGYWAIGTVTDLEPWQAYYRAPVATNRNSPITTNEFPVAPQPQAPAQDVLLALSKYDPAIEELRQASQLPYSRFPLGYDIENLDDILLPHLAALKRSSQVLQLRAIAELQNGESQKAADDVKLSFRLIDSVRTEPFMISDLVRMAMCEITLQPIYEGLAKRQWSDAQLAEIGDELSRLDFLADIQFYMRSDRAFACREIDFLKKSQSYKEYLWLSGAGSFFEDDTTSKGFAKNVRAIEFYLMPAGWFDQSKHAIAEFWQQQLLLHIVDPETHQAFPKIENQVNRLQVNWQSTTRNFLAGLFMDSLAASTRKAAREQASVDLARGAITLERHRLAHGEFPESLDALAPQFSAQVPHDIFGGQPLHYRRTDDGQFVLYSIGPNEKDDGGITGHRNGGSAPDFESGDWVWRYPQK